MANMARTDVEDAIISALRSIVGHEWGGLDAEAELSDAGLDSLHLLELLYLVEDTLDVTIPAEEWRRLRTVADLVQVIEQNAPRPA